eukprot:Tamp_01592.p1 GENE.Tamp_01592~~Tamp_01592.p1  ORF type:complete len:515 (-),score=79.12 Tamp_01592:3623-5047(-)
MGDGAPRDAPGANAGEDADPGREGGRGAADSGDSSATDAAVAEGVAALQELLGEELTAQRAASLFRRANGDISVAVAMHFDDGAADEPAGAANPSAVPVAYAESAHEDDVLEEQMAAFSVQEGTGGPRTPRETSAAQAPTPGGSADRGPTSQVGSAPHNEPRDAHEAGNGVNGNGVERARRRRPGTAPVSRQAAELDAEFEMKAEAMRGVLGADVSDEMLRQLLRATGGDVQLAIEAFFEHDAEGGNGFVFVGAGDAGVHERPPAPEPARRGARRRQRQQDETPGPRKPFEDLAFMLGSDVKANILGPIMVETQGDVPKALEVYVQRSADPQFREEAAQRDPNSYTAEEYYLRPEKPVTVTCNVYDLAWGAEDKEGKKKKVNSGLPGMGFGIYHSGIEVYGREISFGFSDDGLLSLAAKNNAITRARAHAHAHAHAHTHTYAHAHTRTHTCWHGAESWCRRRRHAARASWFACV